MPLRILMAVDGSEHSAAVAQQVGRLCKQIPGAKVTILHVAHPSPPNVDVDIPFDIMVRRTADPIFQNVREVLGLNPEQIREEVGVAQDPAEEILALAKAERFDFIALGARGTSGWREALLGSVAHRVVYNAPCPVLLVH